MKRIQKFAVLITLLALLVLVPVGTGFGKSEAKIKGEITELGTDYLVLDTRDGPVTVYFPEGYQPVDLEIGLSVMVDGSWLENDAFQADAIKLLLDDEDEDDDEMEDGEGEESESTGQNAFCTGEKDTAHPLAAKIAARFATAEGEEGDTPAVSEEQVMAWFCEGNSFGEIMLALMTQKFDGTDPQELLQMRADGMGWGNIWKEKGMIGNEREGLPPGQIIKPDKGTPPGLENKPDKEENTPPGQLKKTPTP